MCFIFLNYWSRALIHTQQHCHSWFLSIIHQLQFIQTSFFFFSFGPKHIATTSRCHVGKSINKRSTQTMPRSKSDDKSPVGNGTVLPRGLFQGVKRGEQRGEIVARCWAPAHVTAAEQESVAAGHVIHSALCLSRFLLASFDVSDYSRRWGGRLRGRFKSLSRATSYATYLPLCRGLILCSLFVVFVWWGAPRLSSSCKKIQLVMLHISSKTR